MHEIGTLLFAGFFAIGAASAPAAAAAESQERAERAYPSKPIRIISPLAPGGSADAIARMVGETLADAFGQPVVVDNRPGANGLIGVDLVAKAAPDGYTLLVASGSNLAVNPALHGSKLPFDVERDLIPIMQIASQSFIAHVSPSFSAKGIRDLIALAKAKPGAITGAQRLAAVSDVPTIAEAGVPGYEATSWQGVVVPAGTPRAIIERLYREIVKVLQTPEVRDRLAAEGTMPAGITPREFAVHIRREIAKWAKVVKVSGAKAD